ncbi:MAG: hypothetical protein ACUVUS_10015, partial [Thermoproteota archaeon]
VIKLARAILLWMNRRQTFNPASHFYEQANSNVAWVSKAGTNDPLHGSWHYYLKSRNIENWDSDYGKGLVFTWGSVQARKSHTNQH